MGTYAQGLKRGMELEGIEWPCRKITVEALLLGVTAYTAGPRFARKKSDPTKVRVEPRAEAKINKVDKASRLVDKYGHHG